MFRYIEKTSYLLLTLWVIIYIVAIIGVVFKIFPETIFIWTTILMLIGLGLLFVKVLVERIKNKEDSYYSKNVRK